MVFDLVLECMFVQVVQGIGGQGGGGIEFGFVDVLFKEIVLVV